MALTGAHTVKYLFTNVFSGALLAELPLTKVGFGLALNQAGPFQTELNVEDPLVQSTNWIQATIPGKTNFWIDIDGQLAYGGRLLKRDWKLGQPTIQLSGQDHISYLAQRLQAGDYAPNSSTGSTNWYSTPASCGDIANTVLTDALAVTNSLPITIVKATQAPSQYWITLVAPITQRQTLDSIVSQLALMGYQVGIDYVATPIYSNGVPTAQITLAYPRAGRAAGTTGLVLDASYALDFGFPEDATGTSNALVEMLAATGGVSGELTSAASLADGFPLTEAVMTHASFSATATPDSVIQAFAQADLAMYAYPVIAPTVKVPLFDDTGSGKFPSWGNWIMGDDVLLNVPVQKGGGPQQNPRFPQGLNYFYRIVRADVQIADQGVSTVNFTMNIPPSTMPPVPPQGSH